MPPRPSKPRFPRRPTHSEPLIGEQIVPSLERIEPSLNGRDSKGSDYEYLKAAYHGVDTSQFADLSVLDRKRFERFLVRSELGKTFFVPYQAYHPMVRYYTSEDGAEQTWLMVSPEEAFYLGRDPSLLGDRAVRAALEAEQSLEYPYDVRPKPHERWRVMQAYRRQVVNSKLRAVSDLFDTMRLRGSNGEHVMKENRLGLAVEVRTTVLHPFIDMVADVQGWKADDRQKMHQVLDIKLLVEGNLDERKKFWVGMVREMKDYLLAVQEVFDRQTGIARKHPDNPWFRGVIDAVVAFERQGGEAPGA